MDKYTLKRVDNGMVFLERNGHQVYCPTQQDGSQCGSWCPAFLNFGFEVDIYCFKDVLQFPIERAEAKCQNAL